MNLFILDENISKSVEYHCDKHVVKMPLETAQMISFAYYHQQKKPDVDLMAFSKTHDKHPCSIWLQSSLTNFVYGCEFGIKLVEEYRFRYNSLKHERALQIFKKSLVCLPEIEDFGLTPFALAMPEQFKSDSAVQSYRDYYCSEKIDLLNYTKRNLPKWVGSRV